MRSDMHDPYQLLTVKQAAQLLAISERSVWRLIKMKLLRARRILGSTRIRRGDIDDFSNDS